MKIKKLPDPDGLNGKRSEWAAEALKAFQDCTRTDAGDALSDLLADLAHYCDQHQLSFADELRRAAFHYEEETEGKGEQLTLLFGAPVEWP